ncbi:MAG: 2-hydroxyacid dehydrogenase [Burkholderiaceae bacterium]|nr:2-hydroxyacid dehydrogenase [Burkholderiaceae bacterium]
MAVDTVYSIIVLDPMAPASIERLKALLPEGFAIECASERGDAHLKTIIADADFAIAGQVAVSGEVLRAARRLRLLHKWGVGVDNIDLEAARECAIKVARTTGSNAVPVAEFTLGLMICAMRGLAGGHAELQKGVWRGFPLPRDPFMISGKTVGIVGFGAIGQRVARLLSGFGCRILYAKRNPLPAAEERALGVEFADMPRLLAESDIVSLHCPLTPQTAGLIDRAALQSMKRTTVLVNVARGGIVVEDDLRWALENRVIHAAATDVYETEPLPADSPLIGLDNLVTTPHLAALAADNFAPTVNRMFANFERVARGEPVPAHELVVG